MIDIDLSKYTLEEVVELKEKCSIHIYHYDDGYEYVCQVRSYGRHWTENVKNKHRLQELCNHYDGENGIVDLYTTNPDMSEFYNYGEVNFIESVEDYKKWKEYNDLNKIINDIEKELERWDNKDNVHFGHRPLFKPTFTQEDLLEYKKQLMEYDMSFKSPVSIKQYDTN